MRKLILTILVIPLVIVIATKSPQATGHIVELLIATGAKVLDGVATFLSDLLGGH